MSGRRVRLEHVAWLTLRRAGMAGGFDGAQHLFYELTVECLRALRPQLSGARDCDASVIAEQIR